MRDEHPCNICKHKLECFEIECPLDHTYNKAYECHQYDCFLNREGSCLINIYDNCGARKSADEGMEH